MKQRFCISQEQRGTAIVWALAILFFAAFSYCIPKVCDDWIFTARLIEAPQHGGLLGAVAHEWRTLNGRVLGNGVSIALAGSKLLRTAFKTAVYAAILFAMGKLSGMNRRAGFGWALTFLCMMLVPAELRKQTYAWDSGFINYAVPTALALCYLLLLSPLFSGERARGSVWRTGACLLLGAACTLFVENVTAYALALGVGTVVWRLVQTRRVDAAAVGFLIGALAGTALMLSSPTYGKTLAGGDAYRAVPTTLAALLARVKSNYQALSCYSFGGYSLLHLLMSGCAIALLLRPDAAGTARRARWLKPALLTLLAALPVYFALSTRLFDFLKLESAAFLTLAGMLGFYPAMALDALFYALYVLALACVLALYVPDAGKRRFGLLCVASALLVSAPMLFVWPIDYRCFLPSWLFWACAALVLADAALCCRSKAVMAARCSLAAMTVACLCNLALYASCPARERTRTAYLEQQMRIEAPIIVLPSFDNEAYLHYPTTLLGEVYHYEQPGDIETPFLPYREWNETFSGGLSEEEIAAYEAAHPSVAPETAP